MSQSIFTQKEVGDYMNAHFVSIAAQMDKTSGDSKEIQSRYADADSLGHTYQVHDLPTYLFFSPYGVALHRFSGSTNDGKSFISKVSDAMDPDKQYYTILARCREHQGDSVFIRQALNSALNYGDNTNAMIIGNYYMNCIKTPISRSNIPLIGELFSTSNDRAFQLYLTNAPIVDSLMENPDYVEQHMAVKVIFKENISPLFNSSAPIVWQKIASDMKAKYPTLGPGFLALLESKFQYDIGHEIKTQVYKEGAPPADWKTISENLTLRFPGYDCQQIILEQMAAYYNDKGIWDSCGKAAESLMKKYGNILGNREINNIAWYYVFLHSTDTTLLVEALDWSARTIRDYPHADHVYTDTYANLLFKNGKKDEAITWEKKAIELAQKNHAKQKVLDTYEINLKKMQNGDQTWKGRDSQDYWQ